MFKIAWKQRAYPLSEMNIRVNGMCLSLTLSLLGVFNLLPERFLY